MLRHLLRQVTKQTETPAVDELSEENLIYQPGIFTVPNMEQAKAIILTPEDGMTTEQRWETETKYLAGAIGDAFELNNNSFVLDYGCGIGRMSKALVERYGCSVIGVDISTSMRQLAPGYAANENFLIVSPDILKKLVANGLRFDYCIAIWVLQHCPNVSCDISLVKSSLKDNGLWYVLNNNASAVPTNKGWINDGVDIKRLLEHEFTVLNYSRLPTTATTQFVSKHSFVAQLRNDKPNS